MKIVQFFASLTLISLPLYIARCKNFSWCASPLPFTLLEVLILVTFFSWFVWRGYQIRKGVISVQKLFESLTGPLFWPLLVFLLAATVSVFFSSDLKAAAGIWKAYFIEPALLGIVVFDLTNFQKSPLWLAPPLFFSGFYVAALTIYQGVSGVDHFAPGSIVSGRATGVYTTPNAVGLYLGPILFLALGFWVESFKKRGFDLKRVGFLLFLAICLAAYLLAIYFSKSRGAALGLIVGLATFSISIIYLNVQESLRKIFRFAAVLAAIAYICLSVGVFVKIDSFVSGYKPLAQDSVASRFCIWQATRNLLVERPITGAGLASYQLVYPKIATCEKVAPLYPHNILLNFWTETGILGLLAFLWVSAVSFAVLVANFRNFIAVGAFAALIYIFIHGLVDVPYFKNDLASVFWVLLAIIVWFGRKKSKVDFIVEP